MNNCVGTTEKDDDCRARNEQSWAGTEGNKHFSCDCHSATEQVIVFSVISETFCSAGSTEYAFLFWVDRSM